MFEREEKLQETELNAFKVYRNSNTGIFEGKRVFCLRGFLQSEPEKDDSLVAVKVCYIRWRWAALQTLQA